MKISFLGTSHGVPSAERYCSCTMLDVGGTLYFIDAGAPLIDLLIRRGADLSRVRALFTTHVHGDHTDGILSFIDLANWYFKQVSADIYLTDARAMALFRELAEAVEAGTPFDAERLRLRLMTPETVYEDENIRVTPVPTRHIDGGRQPSFSYLVEAEGKTVLFTGDLSQKLAMGDFPLRKADLTVCEMAHFGVEEASPYLAKCETGRMVFNHVYPLDKLQKIEALDMRWGYPISILADGDEIEL